MQFKSTLLFLTAALQSAMGLVVRTPDVNVTSREALPKWAIAFYSTQDCDPTKVLFVDTSDEAKECTDLVKRPAYSVRFNGNDAWGALLYYQAECNGGFRFAGPGTTGCLASDDGWYSYEVDEMPSGVIP
jgi:hypothetical protein